jgi:probable rRNA maturation factor
MHGPTFSIGCEVSWDDDARMVVASGGPIDDLHVRRLVAAALYEAGAEAGDAIEVSVGMCGEQRIADANAEHRGIEGATDVLAFPIDGLHEPLGGGEPRVLGDLLVCPAYVARQVEQGLTMQGESTVEAAIERCIVHGALHLCGFDHERSDQDAEEMLALEQLVLDRVRGAGADHGA